MKEGRKEGRGGEGSKGKEEVGITEDGDGKGREGPRIELQNILVF